MGTPIVSPPLDSYDSPGRLFAEIDEDGSGDITDLELINWMKKNNIEVDFGTTAAIIQFFDSDGDGHVTLREIESKNKENELSGGMMCLPTLLNDNVPVVSKFLSSVSNEPKLRRKMNRSVKKKKRVLEFIGNEIKVLLINQLTR